MNQDSQNFESYLPVYDAIPEKWEDARAFIAEQLKKVSNAVNIREIGWYLDEELLSGKSFIPTVAQSQAGDTSSLYRSIFRKVIVFLGLTIGVNTQPHGLTVDANFTLIQLFAGATDSVNFVGEPIPNGIDTISYDATNIIINVTATYTRCYAVIEYIQEL